MKKIININMAGRVVPIDEGAYENLQRYLESLRKFFAHEEGRDEIINDIESRIAELMSDKIKRGAAAIDEPDVEEIISSMGRVEDFEEVEKDETTAFHQTSSEGAHYQDVPPQRGRLFRNSNDKLIGGVCSGIANYLNVDPAIVRLLFAIITFGGFGSGIILYLFFWIILPESPLVTGLTKRLFRNPDDKVIAGVAGGLAAYFHRSATTFRLVFAAPLLINIMVGLLNFLIFHYHRDFFPNVFVGSFTATFLVIYVVLWVVLPEASSDFEKMEMRGEKIDVNRIRANVKSTLEGFEGRMKEWSNEFKETAEQWSTRANKFRQTQGKDFMTDTKQVGKGAVRGIAHVIGVLFKAFFIFVAGCIVLALLAALITLVFGGLAGWQATAFLFSSGWQQLLAWSTVVLFLIVPLVGLITWLIRRMMGVKSGTRYLSWTFSGLWVIGWVALILLAISVKNDIRRFEKVRAELPIVQPIDSVLTVTVSEPRISYTGDMDWLVEDGTGWDVRDDQIRYNNMRVRYTKSSDSSFHVSVNKYSAGSSVADAQQRASAIIFPVELVGSQLQLPAGLGITRAQKFRGQGVIVEIQVPAGKQIVFDRTLGLAYNDGVLRKADPYHYGHSRMSDWDHDDWSSAEYNTKYVMNENGNLDQVRKPLNLSKDSLERQADSIEQELKKREEMDEKTKERLEEINRMIREQRESNLRLPGTDMYSIKAANPFALVIG